MPAGSRPESLEELLAELPDDLAAAGLHTLFLGRAPRRVLRAARVPGRRRPEPRGLDHLYPRFERYGAGRLTKLRAQAVSGFSCARVARALGVPDELRAAAPRGHRPQRGHARRLGARAGLGLRGDHRRAYLSFGFERDRAGRRRGVPRARSSRRSRTRWTTSRSSRSASRGERRSWSTGSTPRRARRTTAASSPSPRWRGRSWAAGRERRRRPPSRRPPCTRLTLSTKWRRS